MAGLNTEVVHNQEHYHVQTQDMGSGSNYVETTVFKSGRVLSSRRSFYTAFLNQPDLSERIQEIIQTEHQAVIQEIENGKFSHL